MPGLSSTTSKADSSSSTEPQSEHSKLKAPLNLREKIMLLHRTESDPLMPILEPNHFPEISEEDSGDLLYHFTMCNPPFFESEAEVQKGRENKVLDPRGVSLWSDLVRLLIFHPHVNSSLILCQFCPDLISPLFYLPQNRSVSPQTQN